MAACKCCINNRSHIARFTAELALSIGPALFCSRGFFKSMTLRKGAACKEVYSVWLAIIMLKVFN